MKNARKTPKNQAGAPGQGVAIVPPTKFLGTANPRYLRILAALMTRSRTREDIDRIAGASNGPAAIAELRDLGLPKDDCLVCEKTPVIDRDGFEVKRGIYHLTDKGRQRVNAWKARRDRGQS